MVFFKKYRTYLAFIFFIIVSFNIHYFLAESLNEANQVLRLIKFGYVLNFILTAILLFAITFISKIAPTQAGYAFLAFSVVKVGIILLSFKIFKVDLEQSGVLHFFIPFFICLFFEVFLLVKLLNSQDFSNNA
ncbi:hypothetical protein DHD80_03360 [Gramella sp. AN32]|nr:hypothetical protein [Gramella sp. AN32]